MSYPENIRKAIAEFAHDLHAVHEPPRWRFIQHRRWRRGWQPSDAEWAVTAALTGEAEPIQRFGIKFDNGDAKESSDAPQ